MYRSMCEKAKEVNPIKINFSFTNKCFDSNQIYDNQRGVKINWTGHLTWEYFFPLKISIAALACCWRNDTYNLCHMIVLIPKSVRP